MPLEKTFSDLNPNELVEQRTKSALLAKAWDSLRAAQSARPVFVGASAYRGVNNADESSWVRCGGRVEDLRGIVQAGCLWNLDRAALSLAAVQESCREYDPLFHTMGERANEVVGLFSHSEYFEPVLAVAAGMVTIQSVEIRYELKQLVSREFFVNIGSIWNVS